MKQGQRRATETKGDNALVLNLPSKWEFTSPHCGFPPSIFILANPADRHRSYEVSDHDAGRNPAGTGDNPHKCLMPT